MGRRSLLTLTSSLFACGGAASSDESAESSASHGEASTTDEAGSGASESGSEAEAQGEAASEAESESESESEAESEAEAESGESGGDGDGDGLSYTWQRVLDPGGSIHALALSPDGDLLLTGSVDEDIWIARYAGADGEAIWSTTHDFAGGPDGGRDLVVASDGSVYVTATAWVGEEEDPDCEGSYEGCVQFYDFVVIGLSSSGALEWSWDLASESEPANEGRAIALGGDGAPTAVGALVPPADQGFALRHFAEGGGLAWSHDQPAYAGASDLACATSGHYAVADARQRWVYGFDGSGAPTFSLDTLDTRLDAIAAVGDAFVGVETLGGEAWGISAAGEHTFTLPGDDAVRAEDVAGLSNGHGASAGSIALAGGGGVRLMWLRGHSPSGEPSFAVDFAVGPLDPSASAAESDRLFAVAMFGERDLGIGGNVTPDESGEVRPFLARVTIE